LSSRSHLVFLIDGLARDQHRLDLQASLLATNRKARFSPHKEAHEANDFQRPRYCPVLSSLLLCELNDPPDVSSLSFADFMRSVPLFHPLSVKGLLRTLFPSFFSSCNMTQSPLPLPALTQSSETWRRSAQSKATVTGNTSSRRDRDLRQSS
jgi:hypothetical protein